MRGCRLIAHKSPLKIKKGEILADVMAERGEIYRIFEIGRIGEMDPILWAKFILFEGRNLSYFMGEIYPALGAKFILFKLL